VSAPATGREAYRRSGVDVEAGHRAVDLIRSVASGATRPEVVGGIGGFAGMVSLGDGRLLVAGTDGVGTKLDIARMAGRLDTVGIDCVAMCANDVVCTGAEPLFVLDYLAVGRLVPEEVADVVAGVAEGCRRAGCALLGGETAEHPGVLDPGQFDLAGFCVGIVGEGDVLGPDRVREGDALIGFASSGLHSNGFSLVRRLLDPTPSSLAETPPGLGRPLGEELLEPTALYVRPLLALARAGLVRAAAHLTGGGWGENVPRALPTGLGAEIDPSAWTAQPIFELLADAAGVPLLEMADVLNLGIGMVAVVGPEDSDRAVAAAEAAGAPAVRLGRVVAGQGVWFDGPDAQ
jgi:phosphoribosylformylglycinamidine cyclo-ligase